MLAVKRHGRQPPADRVRDRRPRTGRALVMPGVADGVTAGRDAEQARSDAAAQERAPGAACWSSRAGTRLAELDFVRRHQILLGSVMAAIGASSVSACPAAASICSRAVVLSLLTGVQLPSG